MTLSLREMEREWRSWSEESLRLAELMFPAGAEAWGQDG